MCLPNPDFAPGKIKTRLVPDEDDKRVAVPPQFAEGALCDWPSPVYAVTGKPVTVYSLVCHNFDVRTKFLRQQLQATSAQLHCGCFHHGFEYRHPSLSGDQRLLLLNDWDYMRRETISQAFSRSGRFFALMLNISDKSTLYSTKPYCLEKLIASLTSINLNLIGHRYTFQHQRLTAWSFQLMETIGDVWGNTIAYSPLHCERVVKGQ